MDVVYEIHVSPQTVAPGEPFGTDDAKKLRFNPALVFPMTDESLFGAVLPETSRTLETTWKREYQQYVKI